jgi:hypothetical protein
MTDCEDERNGAVECFVVRRIPLRRGMKSAASRVSWLAIAAAAFGVGPSFVACKRDSRAGAEEPGDEGKRPARAVARARARALARGRLRGGSTKATVTRYPGADRIVAIGDLHGDLAVTKKVLRLVGAIDRKGRWAGGKMVLVQTGDQIDRGDGDRAIIDLFRRLRKEARKAGGRVIPLNGNHEILNVRGRFSTYVTPGAFRAFRTVPDLRLDRKRVQKYPEPQRARAAALLPGGPYARILSTRPVVAVVGRNVFVHGGVLPKHVRLGLAEINRQTSRWMRGRAPFPNVLSDRSSPVWVRRYSLTADEQSCNLAKQALAAIPAKRMVVGHTVQQRINPACDGKVWRIDVGMSSHYGGPVQALEIRNGKVKVFAFEAGSDKKPKMPRYRQAR